MHENFNGITGDGDFGSWSDPFYHWGALSGFISFMEDGLFP